MTASVPPLLRVVIVAALLVGLVMAALRWSRPESRIPARQKALMSAVSSRNWSKVERLMSENYRDHWHHDRAHARDTLSTVAGGFLTLEVTLQAPVLDIDATGGPEIRGRLRLQGSGGGLAPMVQREVNRLEEPFVFVWEKTGSLPWHWSLLRVEQEELQRRASLNLPGLR